MDLTTKTAAGISRKLITTAAVATLSIVGVSTTTAHITYTGRNFGVFAGGESPIAISQTVTSAFGWADGTDADFGDSHRLRAFRFTLTSALTIRITVESVAFGTGIAGLLPGFSIYSGLVHVAPITDAPGSADYDTSAISLNYLASLGGVPKEGVFEALDDWRVGGENQLGPSFNYDAPDGLSTLVFRGYAVDGTAANFGLTPGIIGDNNADGFVTGTFTLPAGDYSIFAGGGDYQSADLSNYGIKTTLAVLPEPGSFGLALAGCLGLLARRRRR